MSFMRKVTGLLPKIQYVQNMPAQTGIKRWNPGFD